LDVSPIQTANRTTTNKFLSKDARAN